MSTSAQPGTKKKAQDFVQCVLTCITLIRECTQHTAHLGEENKINSEKVRFRMDRTADRKENGQHLPLHQHTLESVEDMALCRDVWFAPCLIPQTQSTAASCSGYSPLAGGQIFGAIPVSKRTTIALKITPSS